MVDAAVAASPGLRKVADAGGMINVFRALTRSPEVASDVVRLGTTLLTNTSLGELDRELVILACGASYRSPYETEQHEQISAAAGVDDAQRAAIADRQWDAACFTEAQRALLTFAAGVAEAPTVPDTAFEAVREHYSERQVVDTITVTGFYFLIARVSTVLDVPIDVPEDNGVLRAALAAKDRS